MHTPPLPTQLRRKRRAAANWQRPSVDAPFGVEHEVSRPSRVRLEILAAARVDDHRVHIGAVREILYPQIFAELPAPRRLLESRPPVGHPVTRREGSVAIVRVDPRPGHLLENRAEAEGCVFPREPG